MQDNTQMIEEEIINYQQAIKLEPKNHSYYRILARLKQQIGDIESSIDLYRQAIKLNIKQPSWVYQHLGVLFYQQKYYNEAISVYRQAIVFYPQDDNCYRVLAKTLQQIGDIEQATEMYYNTIWLNSKQQSWVYERLGNLLIQQELYIEAILVYRQGIVLYPENNIFYQSLSKLQHQTGDVRAAILSYLTAIRIKPNRPIEFYRHIAQILKEKGELDWAISVKNQIIGLNHNLANEAKICIETAILQLTQRATNTLIKTKTYTIYGNCQAIILANFLNSSESFKSQYQYLTIKPVHKINKYEIKELINNILPKTDLFIYQPVSEEYKGKEYSSNYLLQKLNLKSRNISFPSCYFKGYNPELKILKDCKGRSISDKFDYHDFHIIQGFLRSSPIEQVKANIQNSSYYSQDYSQSQVEQSLKELEKRENSIFGTKRQINIKISNFIRENYKKQRLFYTINHPSKFVFKYMAEEIIKLLNIKDEITLDKDFLNHTTYPIYESHYHNLELKFANPMQYTIRNNIYELHTTINKYFEYYSCIEKNVIRNNIHTTIS